MKIIQHPRFENLEIVAINNTESSFEGAVCSQVDAQVWFLPDEEDPFGRVSFIQSTIGNDNGVSRTYDMLADICSTCPALTECFNYAIHHEDYGFWGGATRNEREELRKKHRITLTEPFDSDTADRMILKTRALIEEIGGDKGGNA